MSSACDILFTLAVVISVILGECFRLAILLRSDIILVANGNMERLKYRIAFRVLSNSYTLIAFDWGLPKITSCCLI